MRAETTPLGRKGPSAAKRPWRRDRAVQGGGSRRPSESALHRSVRALGPGGQGPPLLPETLGRRRALSESHARGASRGRGVNGVPEGSYTWPCGLMDKALVFGSKDCRPESCQGHACAFVGPAACPRHAARCHLGPRQRAGARRGGEPSGRHARTPQASAWVERATAGPPRPRAGRRLQSATLPISQDGRLLDCVVS